MRASAVLGVILLVVGFAILYILRDLLVKVILVLLGVIGLVIGIVLILVGLALIAGVGRWRVSRMRGYFGPATET